MATTRFTVHAWKVCVLSKVPWVRIPLSPPLISLYFTAKNKYYKNMKRKKSLTQTQYAECYAKALTYAAQILVGIFFIAVLILIF